LENGHTFPNLCFWTQHVFLSLRIKFNHSWMKNGQLTQFHWFWQLMHAEIGGKKLLSRAKTPKFQER
jgi:hypothetical protein